MSEPSPPTPPSSSEKPHRTVARQPCSNATSARTPLPPSRYHSRSSLALQHSSTPPKKRTGGQRHAAPSLEALTSSSPYSSPIKVPQGRPSVDSTAWRSNNVSHKAALASTFNARAVVSSLGFYPLTSRTTSGPDTVQCSQHSTDDDEDFVCRGAIAFDRAVAELNHQDIAERAARICALFERLSTMPQYCPLAVETEADETIRPSKTRRRSHSRSGRPKRTRVRAKTASSSHLTDSPNRPNDGLLAARTANASSDADWGSSTASSNSVVSVTPTSKVRRASGVVHEHAATPSAHTRSLSTPYHQTVSRPPLPHHPESYEGSRSSRPNAKALHKGDRSSDRKLALLQPVSPGYKPYVSPFESPSVARFLLDDSSKTAMPSCDIRTLKKKASEPVLSAVGNEDRTSMKSRARIVAVQAGLKSAAPSPTRAKGLIGDKSALLLDTNVIQSYEDVDMNSEPDASMRSSSPIPFNHMSLVQLWKGSTTGALKNDATAAPCAPRSNRLRTLSAIAQHVVPPRQQSLTPNKLSTLPKRQSRQALRERHNSVASPKA